MCLKYGAAIVYLVGAKLSVAILGKVILQDELFPKLCFSVCDAQMI